MQVNILEAKNRLSQLVKTVQAGEEVVIANRGQPVARLVSVRHADFREPARSESAGIISPRTPGGILNWLKENPLPPYARRSVEEIDADIAAERHAWD